MTPTYKINDIIYVVFNHDIQKVVIKKIIITADGVVYNDYITENMIHKTQNAAHTVLMNNFSKLIKIVDKTK